jgi:hypothetical protein
LSCIHIQIHNVNILIVRPIFKIFLVETILSIRMATLEIYSPLSARDQLNRTITYTVANFGHIPFEKTLVGPLYVTDPLGAY